MALYKMSLTVPATTPENRPAEIVLSPTAGYVRRVKVTWKKGALHTIGIRIMDEGRQFAPLPYGWMYGDNETTEWVENRRLQGPPYRVVIQGHSNALDWPHTAIIEMEIT